MKLYFTGLYVHVQNVCTEMDKSAPKQSQQHDSRLKCYCIRIHCLNIVELVVWPKAC